MANHYAVWVGIDWADKKNAFALRVTEGDKIQHGSFLQRASSIEDWVRSVQKLARGGKVAVALEQSKGGLIFALMKYDFIVLYPLNPNTFAKYRDAWKPSGAKDDPTDAALILDLLERHHAKLTAWVPEPDNIRTLQRLTEQRVRLMNDLKRIGNKLTTSLKEYFPAALDLFPRIYRNVVADFLLAYPTLEDVQAASDQELRSFFREHSSGGAKLAEKRITLLRAALPLTTDRAVIDSNALFVKALAQQLKTLNACIAEYNTQIESVYAELPDRQIFDSLPCAGEVSAPRLLAAFGTDRSRFASADELLAFLGISPVIERSGNQSWTRWRYKCNKPLRQAVIEWAFLSLRNCFWAEQLYKKLRAKGKSHPTAVRAIAFKWVRIIFRLWKDRVPYSEARYLKALQKAGSPLIGTYSPQEA